MKPLCKKNCKEYTVPRVLKEYDRLGVTRLSDNKYHIRYKLTNKQKVILKQLGISESNDASFIFIDDFDAYYHYELVEKIVKYVLDKRPNAQILFTSHNTNLMTNELFRPDCLFIIQEKQIKSLVFLTDKELRYAHNLQKMYRAGAFNE